MSSKNTTQIKYDAENPKVQEALRTAWDSRKNAWVPYSGFRVGAALYIPAVDQIVCGANVENVSYGATICAERSAIVAAISRYGKVEFGFIVVATDADPPASPCGICLQVLVEFCTPDFPVFLCNKNGLYKSAKLSDFLPQAFTSFTVANPSKT